MKKNELVKNIPLMYIVQPNLSPVTTNMQQSLILTKPKIKHKEENIPQLEEVAGKLGINSEKENEAKEKKKFKQFQEMTIHEQVEFLLNLPSKLQIIQCVIATKDRKYYGAILDCQDEVVSFSYSSDKQPLTLNINEIEKITIIDVKE